MSIHCKLKAHNPPSFNCLGSCPYIGIPFLTFVYISSVHRFQLFVKIVTGEWVCWFDVDEEMLELGDASITNVQDCHTSNPGCYLLDYWHYIKWDRKLVKLSDIGFTMWRKLFSTGVFNVVGQSNRLKQRGKVCQLHHRIRSKTKTNLFLCTDILLCFMSI